MAIDRFDNSFAIITCNLTNKTSAILVYNYMEVIKHDYNYISVAIMTTRCYLNAIAIGYLVITVLC